MAGVSPMYHNRCCTAVWACVQVVVHGIPWAYDDDKLRDIFSASTLNISNAEVVYGKDSKSRVSSHFVLSLLLNYRFRKSLAEVHLYLWQLLGLVLFIMVTHTQSTCFLYPASAFAYLCIAALCHHDRSMHP